MNQESEVREAMNAYVEARINGDTDVVIDSYSEDWEDSKGFKKSSLREGHLPFTAGSVKTDIKVDLSAVEVVIDGDSATCRNVRPFGTLRVV